MRSGCRPPIRKWYRAHVFSMWLCIMVYQTELGMQSDRKYSTTCLIARIFQARRLRFTVILIHRFFMFTHSLHWHRQHWTRHFLMQMIQAVENYKNGSTGQLSGISIGLMFLGSVARVFTSFQETGDMTLILTFIVSSLCNGILLTQVPTPHLWLKLLKP